MNKEPTKVKIKMRIEKGGSMGSQLGDQGNKTHEIEMCMQTRNTQKIKMRMPTRNTHAIQEEFQWT